MPLGMSTLHNPWGKRCKCVSYAIHPLLSVGKGGMFDLLCSKKPRVQLSNMLYVTCACRMLKGHNSGNTKSIRL